jgi:hypothetical protein
MRAPVALLAALLATLACGRQETPAPAAPAPAQTPPVSAPTPTAALPQIELGKAIASDGSVSTPASVFAPADTIYASVLTEGQPQGATLSARWTFEDGQLVSENQQALAGPGRVHTEFHIAKPDGWPAGRYRVEIALNGQSAGARDFEVR